MNIQSLLTRRIPGLMTVLTLTVLASFSLAGRPAQAQTTVYSTFGPGNSFTTNTSFAESGPNSSQGDVSLGATFTVSQSGSLFSITAAYSNIEGPNIGHLYLTDSVANLGNTAASLESFTFTNLPDGATIFSPEVLTSSLSPTLRTGTTYYLYGLETGATLDGFQYNDQGLTGLLYGSSGAAYTPLTYFLPAFSVQVTPAAVTATPEPASYAAFAMGGIGLLGLGLKARKSRLNA